VRDRSDLYSAQRVAERARGTIRGVAAVYNRHEYPAGRAAGVGERLRAIIR